MFATLIPTLLYLLTSTLFILPFILEGWSPPTATLKIISLVVRFVSILVNIALPAEARSFFFKTDKVFVFYEYIFFNLSFAFPPFIYCKFPIYINLRQQFITVVSEYITVPVLINRDPHHKPRHLSRRRSLLFLSHHPRIFSRPWLFQPIPSGPLAHTKGAWCRGIYYARGTFCWAICLLWTQLWGGIVGPTSEGKSTPPYFLSALSSVSFAAHQLEDWILWQLMLWCLGLGMKGRWCRYGIKLDGHLGLLS